MVNPGGAYCIPSRNITFRDGINLKRIKYRNGGRHTRKAGELDDSQGFCMGQSPDCTVPVTAVSADPHNSFQLLPVLENYFSMKALAKTDIIGILTLLKMMHSKGRRAHYMRSYLLL